MQPLLAAPNRLRNVCILAHVDHGKTTLTDSLLASNGIISHKQAGKLRYLDSRDDEQQRGITMESSAISLLFDDRRTIPTRWAVNLIDSPGHVDFAGHVVTASRLCDGAAVLVDVVEGVCTQTMAVLRQAHAEHLKLALVINKIDRLVVELRMDCQEAASCIFKLVEHVNAVYGAIDKDQGSSYFDPVIKGNVVFASATDGWAFSLSHFAKLYSEKLNLKYEDVLNGLWGQDSVFDVKGRTFYKSDSNSKCAFAQLALHNIWSIYNHQQNGNLEQICKSLQVHLTERDMKGDSRSISRQVLSSWLPLSSALFHVFIDCLPAPEEEVVLDRLDHLVPFKDSDEKSSWKPLIDSNTVLCQIAKMFSIQFSSAQSNGEMLVGMARLFSGSLTVGQTVYYLSPKYDPIRRDPNTFHEYTVDQLFLLMGREMEPVETVYAGNVFGIGGGGLEKMVFKSGTLSSSLDVLPLTNTNSSIPLLIKVAVTPTDINDLQKLQKGLETLCQADPVAETFLQSNGEQVLAVAGELHLEVCLKDLKERFTNNLDFTVSEPLVPFRETFTVGTRNSMDTMYSDLLCDVFVVDEETGLLNVNFGYCQLQVSCSVDNDQHIELTNKQSSRLVVCPGVEITKALESSLVAGFRLAVDCGTLCGEPVSDVNIVLSSMIFTGTDLAEASGRLITDFSQCCHAAMLYWSPRLKLAVYKCDIQTSADFLGRVYGVLSKRRGQVLMEEYNESTNFFTIHSMLPVIESFGFGHDLRSKTSGIAVPQLLFDGFQLLDIDPFSVKEDDANGHDDTEQDCTDQAPNDALRYLIKVRERKGLYVERRIVECADKQRTRRRWDTFSIYT